MGFSLQAKNYTPSESKRNILNKSMLGGNSTADAMSAINRSTTMATGVPIAVGSTPTTSSQCEWFLFQCCLFFNVRYLNGIFLLFFKN